MTFPVPPAATTLKGVVRPPLQRVCVLNGWAVNVGLATIIICAGFDVTLQLVTG